MNMLKGINEHFPIVFDTLHFSSVHISVYSMLTGTFISFTILIDFKFRKKLLSEIKESSALRSSESGIKIIKIKQAQKPKTKKMGLVKMNSLTELLFSEDKEDENSVGYLPIEVDSKEVEKVH